HGTQRVFWFRPDAPTLHALPEAMMKTAPIFSDDGRFMASDASPSEVTLWSLPEMTSRTLPRIFSDAHPLPTRPAAACLDRAPQWLQFSPQGRFLASNFACGH